MLLGMRNSPLAILILVYNKNKTRAHTHTDTYAYVKREIIVPARCNYSFGAIIKNVNNRRNCSQTENKYISMALLRSMFFSVSLSLSLSLPLLVKPSCFPLCSVHDCQPLTCSLPGCLFVDGWKARNEPKQKKKAAPNDQPNRSASCGNVKNKILTPTDPKWPHVRTSGWTHEGQWGQQQKINKKMGEVMWKSNLCFPPRQSPTALIGSLMPRRKKMPHPHAPPKMASACGQKRGPKIWCFLSPFFEDAIAASFASPLNEIKGNTPGGWRKKANAAWNQAGAKNSVECN